MTIFMADENKEEPKALEEETETSEESSPKPTVEEEAPKKEEEPQVPLSRLREEVDKRKGLEKELQKSKEVEFPEDERKIREIIEKREKENLETLKRLEEEQREEIDKLHQIFGEFNDEKFIEFTEDNPIKKDDGNLDYLKMINLYQRTGGEGAPKKKIPSSERTTDVPRKEPYDVKGKNMWDILEEAKKEIPE